MNPRRARSLRTSICELRPCRPFNPFRPVTDWRSWWMIWLTTIGAPFKFFKWPLDCRIGKVILLGTFLTITEVLDGHTLWTFAPVSLVMTSSGISLMFARTMLTVDLWMVILSIRALHIMEAVLQLMKAQNASFRLIDASYCICGDWHLYVWKSKKVQVENGLSYGCSLV